MVTTKTRSKTLPSAVAPCVDPTDCIAIDLEAAKDQSEPTKTSPEFSPPHSVTPEKSPVETPKSQQPQKAPSKPTKYKRSVKPLASVSFAKSGSTSSMNYHHRLCIYRTKTGEALFQAKLPRLNDKAAYTSPQENYVLANVGLMEKYRLSKYCVLRAEQANTALPDGRGSVWRAGVYIHEDPAVNTDEWAKRWGNNWAKLYHQLTMKERNLSKYENEYSVVMMQDDNIAANTVLGDLLIYEDVLSVIVDAYFNQDVKRLMQDDEFVADYFGAGNVVEARVMFNQIYGEQFGNLYVNENMNDDPTNLIDGFEDV